MNILTNVKGAPLAALMLGVWNVETLIRIRYFCSAKGSRTK